MPICKINSLFHQIDLSLLKHFSAIATYGGFSRASRATGTSQPALSLGLMRLEKSLGVKLVDRKAKQFLLTEAGVLVLNFCQRFESGLESTVASISTQNMSHRRLLRIGTARSIGYAPLAPLCAFTAHSEEAIEFDLITHDAYRLLSDLVDGSIDAALVPDDVYDKRLRFMKISQDPVTFAVGRSFEKLFAKDSWREAMGILTLVTYPRESPLRALVDKLRKREHLEFKAIYSVNSVDAIKLFLTHDVGGAFVLRSLIETELRNRAIFEPKLPFALPKSGLVLATREGDQGQEISRLLMQWMVSGNKR